MTTVETGRDDDGAERDPQAPPRAGGGPEGDAGLDASEVLRVLTAVSGVPVSRGNRLELLRNGDEIFPAMLDAIESAERSVDLLTFVYWSGDIAGRFATTLALAARRGVRVRVLLDALGAKSIERAVVERMRSAGCDVRYFRPPDPRHPLKATHRTHRKVLVCDETVGFTGGVGIADEWSGDGRSDGCWRDTHVRLLGPAVAGLRASFLDNWIETDSTIFQPAFDHFPETGAPGDSSVQVIKGSAEPGWNDVSISVRALIELARRTIRITTAYFVPDDDLQMRLIRASERGVDVSLLLPGPHADKRFVQVAGEKRYRELLDRGVQVHSYQPSMLHAKVMTVDRAAAVIGSANFNHRSTHLDEEVNLIVFDGAVAAELDDDFDADLGYSEELDPRRWRRRSLPQRLLEQGIDLARPWM
jgi:cardiolipin synthase